MLQHPMIDKLKQLRCKAMAQALSEQFSNPSIDTLSFEERLGLLIDIEATARDNQRLQLQLRKAKLKQDACVENIDYAAPRGLDKRMVLSLTQCLWIKTHQNLLIVGPTGTGKTFLACALAHKACLTGYSTRYYRLPRLLADLQIAKGDGRYTHVMKELARADVLLLDDFGLTPLADEHQRDLLEILDERHERASTIITSQLPIKLWHETIGNNTLADAILDRLVHNAHRVEMIGDSMRKRKSLLTPPAEIG